MLTCVCACVCARMCEAKMAECCPELEEDVSSASEKRVKLFRTLAEFKRHANSLPLNRLRFQNVASHDSLDGYYVGGKVVSIMSESYSQGHDSLVFLEEEDAEQDPFQIMMRVSGELVELLPTLNTDFAVFVAGANLEDDDVDFSQDTGKCVVVEGPNVEVWVVHPKAGDPRLYERVCGPNWWKEQKKKAQRRKQAREEKARLPSLANKKGNFPVPLETSHHVGGIEHPSPSSVKLSPSVPWGMEPGPSGIDGMEPGPSGIDGMEPGPSGIDGMEPGPSGIDGMEPGPSGIDGMEPGPSGIDGIEPGPSGIDGMEPGPSGMELRPCTKRGAHPGTAVKAYSRSTQRSHQQSVSAADDGGSESSTSEDSDSSAFRESETSSSSGDTSETLWTPKKSSASYEYTKLADLRPSLDRINVIGVVKEFWNPRETRGTQFCSVLTIIDETNPRVGVKCIMFSVKAERLPQIKREGDIVCFHRVKINKYREVAQIEGPPFSNSMRFSSKVGRKLKPTTGSLTYTFTATERKRVRELRQFVLKRRRLELAQKLESISAGIEFNLLCQVVWIAQPSSSNQTVFSVWDGTICPLPIKHCGLHDADLSSDPSLATSVGPELQHQIVAEGRLPHKLKIRPGSYICLSNVTVSSHTGTESDEIELLVKGPLERNVELVTTHGCGGSELKQRLEGALASQEVVTSTLHDAMPLSTLMGVRDYPLHGKPAKFRCMVKLVRIVTPSLEESVLLKCEQCSLLQPLPKSSLTDAKSGVCMEPCPVCYEAGQWLLESPPPHCMFLIRLLLADSSASLEVHVSHKEAINLFRGLQPANFYQHQMSRYRLMTMFYCLSGGNPPFSQWSGGKVRPWISCCLIKVEHNQKPYYCLFDTALNRD